MCLKRPDLLREPLLQQHIVCIPPQQGHCGVGVGVDKAWDGKPVGAVDDDIGVDRPPGVLPDRGDRSGLVDRDVCSRSVDGGPGDQDRAPGSKDVI